MKNFVVLIGLVYLILKNFSSAQLSNSETLIIKTFCDLSNVSINCETNNVIALQQVQYGYATRCNTQCCQSKEIEDCLVTVTDTTDFKRQCSGISSCYPPVVSSHVFCSFDRQAASYVYLEYYCIPESRITSVCSGTTTTITSAGEPLYLTNPGYPGATVGSRSCSCSFEAESCTSGTSSFIIDADLYSEPSSCNQSLLITAVDGELRESIKCESYYDSFVTQKKLMSNYYNIHFESNSTHNLEGYLFIGFTASNFNVPFSLTCSNKSATWCIASCGPSHWQCQNGQCISDSARCDNSPDCNDQSDEQYCLDCGPVPSISAGNITLQDPYNTTYGATANVKCATGYKANKASIFCQASGMWESTNCTVIDCGQLPSIPAGSLILADPKNTSYGASATVTCLTGYQANVISISCSASGLWENASCRAVAGCGSSQWRCADGQCISYSATCDNVPDCIDETDEQNCTDSLLPATEITQNDNSNTILIIVLVLVFGVSCLIQLCVATCLYVMIYRTYNSDSGKAVLFVLLSAIPYIGIAFIIRFHKTFHENERKSHSQPQQFHIISRNSAVDHSTIGQPSAEIGNGNSNDVEDETSVQHTAHDDTADHYDYIDMEPEAKTTENTRGTHSTTAMEHSAVLKSNIELHDEGKTYQDLRPERRHSDRYTELRSSANRHKGSDQYTKLPIENHQKGPDQYTNLQSDSLQKVSDQYTNLQSDSLQTVSDQYTKLQSDDLEKVSDQYTKLQSDDL